MEEKNLSVVIPTYNGKELLEEYLPSVLEACKNYSLGKTELIVVDDASSDGTLEYLKSNLPDVKTIEHPANRGFSISANHGIQAAENQIIVLLNNDVRVSRDFFHFLPQHFEAETTFAVRPCIESGRNEDEDNFANPRIGGEFRFGFIQVPVRKTSHLHFSFFAGGGASAIDKKKFEELGGFDELFSPFYFEDVDLSYRAWKRGWKIIYEPRSLVYHQGRMTISKFYRRRKISRISERNKYFLIWKNITDRKLLLQNLLFTPLRIFAFLARGKMAPLTGFFSALKMIKPVLKERRMLKETAQLSDREIFSLFRE